MASVTDLMERAKVAFNRLNYMQELYRDSYALGAPNREGFETINGVETPGEPKQRQVFDSTFQDAVDRLANAYFVGMFPSWLPWINFAPGSEIEEEERENTAELLQYPTKIITENIAATNFYGEVHPMLIDWIFGTGAMEINPDPTVDVRYTAIPLYQLGLEPGKFGTIDATFRKYKMLARNVKINFPNAKLSAAFETVLNSGPDNDVTIISAVIPEQVGLRSHVQYIMWEDGPEIIDSKEFFENPVVVCRHSVLTGEIYGRGPALKSTATAYSLNECAKLILMAANMGIMGMWTVTDDGINPDTFKIGPAALIPVDSNDNANPSMRALPSSAQMDFGQFAQDDLRSQIQRNLSVDQMGNVEGPKATAYEIQQRIGLTMKDEGAAFSRLNNEFTKPAITRHAGILSRMGKLPPIKVDGKIITLKYTSPIARAQSMDEIMSMRALREETALHAELDPTAAARLDNGAMLKRQAELSGINMTYVRSDEEVAKITAQIAEAQTAMNATAEEGAV